MIAIKITEVADKLPELIAQIAGKSEPIVLMSEGKAQAVLLGVEIFEKLLGIHEYANRPSVPLDILQQQFKQALVEGGYDTHQKIVELVKDVKREIADERKDQSIVDNTL
ncbi:hypothetical protein [Lusitaniella coriacea]|uniref:hypothetical protein n=1 Tax=Lusitaniella coriacea TaxID=1983105 RepID=UPI003CF20532